MDDNSFYNALAKFISDNDKLIKNEKIVYNNEKVAVYLKSSLKDCIHSYKEILSDIKKVDKKLNEFDLALDVLENHLIKKPKHFDTLRVQHPEDINTCSGLNFALGMSFGASIICRKTLKLLAESDDK